MAQSIEVNVHLQGDSPPRLKSFPIKFEYATTRVLDLRRMVHSERWVLAPVSTVDLELWKLNVPVPVDEQDQQLPLVEQDLQSHAKMMEPWSNFSDYFSVTDTLRDFVQIVAVAPDLRTPQSSPQRTTLLKLFPPKVSPSESGSSFGELQSIRDKILHHSGHLHSAVRHFLLRPMSHWQPPNDDIDDTTRNFYDELRIPLYLGKPNLLSHDLNSSAVNPKVLKFLQYKEHTLIYNTSGAGKTRLVLEILTQNWGFSLVAQEGPDKIGWSDLESAIATMRFHRDWRENIFTNNPSQEEIESNNASNLVIAEKLLLKVLIARWVVFSVFIEVAKELNNGHLPTNLKHEWVLFQALPRMSRIDIFHSIIDNCLLGFEYDTLQAFMKEFDTRKILGSQFDPATEEFVYVLDNAQVAGELCPYAFADARNGSPCSVLRPIIGAMHRTNSNLRPIRIVLSGANLSIGMLENMLTSSVGIGKSALWRQEDDINDFMDQNAQLAYLSRYLPPSFLKSPTGKTFKARMSEWIQGWHVVFVAYHTKILILSFSPRLLANFLEELLQGPWKNNAPASPQELLNEYVHCLSKHKLIGGPSDITDQEPDVSPREPQKFATAQQV
ncbi:hypothetical protein FRC17_002596 [Serendipita sp. 399]|nr:hypothetical protein FRC17_002596 [Serendipita sp. 399]